jgi:hypothetical protein
MIISVDAQFNPSNQKKIDSSTKLATGITCAKFLGARGSRAQFEKLYNANFTAGQDRYQVARNLVLHAQAMRNVVENKEFTDHRLIVSEGLYQPRIEFQYSIVDKKRVGTYIGEVPSGVNSLKRDGRAIVYQLIDKDGKTDPAKTFDLAVYWKDYIKYDKLILDYDHYDPDGSLTSQIVLVMPTVPESYDVSFAMKIETQYNGTLQTINELLEILP